MIDFRDRIHIINPPNEILNEMFHIAKEAFNKNIKHTHIGEQFFDNGRILEISNFDWKAICNAIVIVSMKSEFNSLHLTSLSHIISDIKVQYQNVIIQSPLTKFCTETKEIEIINMDDVITTINTVICQKCKNLKSKCKCFNTKPTRIDDTAEGINIKRICPPEYYDGKRVLDNIRTIDDLNVLGIFNKQNNVESTIDISKFDEILIGLASTMKLKKSDVYSMAQDIIKQNSSVTGEELVRQILRHKK